MASTGLSLLSLSGIVNAQDMSSSLQSASPLTTKPKTPGDAYWATAGSSNTPGPVVGPNGILANSVIHATPANSIPLARAEAIQEAAATYGAQSGLAYEVQQITDDLQRHASEYNRIFNFSAVMLQPGFLPPVISEGHDLYNQTDGSTVREAEVLYKIEEPARLVNVPPRWQDYLTLGVAPPQLPDQTVLPHTADEKALWNSWATKGWAQGVEQAKQMFEANAGRLERDYNGMLRFKRLYEMNLVSRPVLAQSKLGVTGGGNEMAIGDRIIRITMPSSLNPNSKSWAPQAPSTVLPEDMPQGTNVNH